MRFLLMVLAIAVLAAGLVATVWHVLRTYRRWRGERIVTCPETGKPAGVAVDARHALATGMRGTPELRLQDCSRWPERQGCGQECLAQIEQAPHECLVRTQLAAWYADRTCTLCGKDFGDIDWYDHKPALLAEDGTTKAWGEFQPEQLPEAFETYQPICWDCHVIESVIRQHPDRVTLRERDEHLI